MFYSIKKNVHQFNPIEEQLFKWKSNNPRSYIDDLTYINDNKVELYIDIYDIIYHFHLNYENNIWNFILVANQYKKICVQVYNMIKRINKLKIDNLLNLLETIETMVDELDSDDEIETDEEPINDEPINEEPKNDQPNNEESNNKELIESLINSEPDDEINIIINEKTKLFVKMNNKDREGWTVDKIYGFYELRLLVNNMIERINIFNIMRTVKEDVRKLIESYNSYHSVPRYRSPIKHYEFSNLTLISIHDNNFKYQ